MSKPNLFEKLQKLQQSTNDDFYEKACTEAYNHILEDHETLMEAAARMHKDRAYLYRWNYESDPRSTKFRFNGVRISDIVRHGDLIERLNTYFKEINPQFYVASHAFKKEPGDKRNTRYGIYVSWAEKKETKETKDKDESTKSAKSTDRTKSKTKSKYNSKSKSKSSAKVASSDSGSVAEEVADEEVDVEEA